MIRVTGVVGVSAMYATTINCAAIRPNRTIKVSSTPFLPKSKRKRNRGLKQYVIEMEFGDGWKDGEDKGIKSDIYGWQDAKSYMSLFTPLRRHLLVDWYQPIACISDKLFDRYPLLAGQTILKAKSSVDTTE